MLIVILDYRQVPRRNECTIWTAASSTIYHEWFVQFWRKRTKFLTDVSGTTSQFPFLSNPFSLFQTYTDAFSSTNSLYTKQWSLKQKPAKWVAVYLMNIIWQTSQPRIVCYIADTVTRRIKPSSRHKEPALIARSLWNLSSAWKSDTRFNSASSIRNYLMQWVQTNLPISWIASESASLDWLQPGKHLTVYTFCLFQYWCTDDFRESHASSERDRSVQACRRFAESQWWSSDDAICSWFYCTIGEFA